MGREGKAAQHTDASGWRDSAVSTAKVLGIGRGEPLVGAEDLYLAQVVGHVADLDPLAERYRSLTDPCACQPIGGPLLAKARHQ